MEQFRNKMLYINSNTMYIGVERLLQSKGFRLIGAFNSVNHKFNYLYYSYRSRQFYIDYKSASIDEEISLEEFKTLLEYRKPKVFTEQEVKDILLSISPNKTELPEYPKNGTDIDKVEWGILKASVHHTEVINNYIEKHL